MELKERIIIGATELFFKEGVRRVTMDQIAAYLGVSKRTIYETFSNKDELLKECIITHIQLQQEENSRIAAESETALHFFLNLLSKGVENLKTSNPQFVNDVRTYYPKIWSSIICTNRDYNVFQIIKLIQQGINEGVFRNDFEIPLISKLLTEIMSLLVDHDIFPPHIYAPAKLYTDSVMVLIRGICTSKGLEYIDNYLTTNLAFETKQA